MSIKVKFFNTGFCKSLKKFAIRTSPWRCCKFPAMFTLIQHPDYGNILFDTGHSDKFTQLTKKFPMAIYRWLIPVEHDAKSAAGYQLQSTGIKPKDINYIIISHFHADHIGSLSDFPQAKFIYLNQGYQAVKNLNRFAALLAGFLSALIPDNFIERSHLLDNQPLIALPGEYLPFKFGYQVFGDDSIIAVELPGHAVGHIGLFLKVNANERIFLVADACWTSEAYLQLIPPHPFAFLIMANKKAYLQTLRAIHDLHQHSPNIKIIPAHCEKTWADINGKTLNSFEFEVADNTT